MKMLRMAICCVVVFLTIPLVSGFSAGLPELPDTDVDGYSIGIVVCDNKTGGEVQSTTRLVRRIYTITNNSNREIRIPYFSVYGFAMVNVITGEALDSGGSGYVYDNVRVPPHSTVTVGSNDRSTIEKPRRGKYRCVSGIGLFFDAADLRQVVDVQTETFINVK